MQPYVENYLGNVNNNIALMRADTKNLFISWNNFVGKIKHIFQGSRRRKPGRESYHSPKTKEVSVFLHS